MKLATCRHCQQPLLPTYNLCPRCGLINKRPNRLVWFCGGAWLLAILVFVSGLVFV